MISWKRLVAACILLASFILGGCNSHQTEPEATTGGLIRISVKTVNSLGKVQLVDGVQLEQARILVNTIQLHEQGGGSHRIGPFVLDLNLAGSLNNISATYVPYGTYNRVDFIVAGVHAADIEGLPESEREVFSDFLESDGSSVIADGRILNNGNAVPFRYFSRVHAEQQTQLQPPIIISPESPSANLTMIINTDHWFRNQHRNFLDPTNPADIPIIEENIRRSITLIHDDNQDGEDDHGGGGGGDDDGDDENDDEDDDEDDDEEDDDDDEEDDDDDNGGD